MSRRVFVYKRIWLDSNEAPGRKEPVRVYTDQALFHEFGCAYAEFESGPANYSTAIVEFDCGRVIEVMPDMIEFITKESAARMRESVEKNGRHPHE